MKILQLISAWLARQTPLFVTLVAVLAYFVPNLFTWVYGTSQTVVLGTIMLTMGMTLTQADFRILARRPWEIALGTLAQYTLMPGIAWCIVKGLGLPDGLAIGLVLVGCCPGGVSSNIMSFLCRGDVAFSVGMTTVSTLLSPIMTPLLMLFLVGERVEIDAVGMFKSVLVVTLAPVIAGFLLNQCLGRRPVYREALQIMPGIAVIGLACIVGGVAAAHGEKIVTSGMLIFTAVFLHNALGYVLGYWVGMVTRMTRAKRRTISIEVGMQNAGLATVLAGRHFPTSPEAAVASAVSCVWHSITGALLAGLFNVLERLIERRK